MNGRMTRTRTSPNIIITGTPGVGKSSHCEALVETSGLRLISVNDVVKEECHEGWDDEYSCWIVDEDKLLDTIEYDVLAGGCLIDWHACDLFPERWIDLVIVLRADTATLYDRLKKRNYREAKLQENLDTEIMQVLLDEAMGAFANEIVIELQSNTVEDMDANVNRIVAWVKQWKKDHEDGVSGEIEGDQEDQEARGEGR